MKKVITYGTFDLLHHGHIKILERAKALGDYLIVGVTANDYDKSRGKINVQQTLIERVLGVKETGLADEIIVEENPERNILSSQGNALKFDMQGIKTHNHVIFVSDESEKNNSISVFIFCCYYKIYSRCLVWEAFGKFKICHICV